MNKIKEVCELLGLDWIEEEKRSSYFNIAGSNAIFRFDNCGFLLCKVDDTGWYHSEYSNIISIICGSTAISPIKMAEPIKCFKNGDKYSYISGDDKTYHRVYVNDMYDQMFMYFGNMFDVDAVIPDYQRKEIFQRIKDGIPYSWEDNNNSINTEEYIPEYGEVYWSYVLDDKKRLAVKSYTRYNHCTDLTRIMMGNCYMTENDAIADKPMRYKFLNAIKSGRFDQYPNQCDNK